MLCFVRRFRACQWFGFTVGLRRFLPRFCENRPDGWMYSNLPPLADALFGISSRGGRESDSRRILRLRPGQRVRFGIAVPSKTQCSFSTTLICRMPSGRTLCPSWASLWNVIRLPGCATWRNSMQKRALQPHFGAVVLSYHRMRRHFSVRMLTDCIKGLRAGGAASVRPAMSVQLFRVAGLMNETGSDSTETLFEGATLRRTVIRGPPVASLRPAILQEHSLHSVPHRFGLTR